jgi:hypothetical protein
MLLPTLATALAIVIGKVLVWDLFGWVGRLSGEAPASGGFLQRLSNALVGEWMRVGPWNAVAILLAIVLAGNLECVFQWWQRNPSQDDAEPEGKAMPPAISWTIIAMWVGFATLGWWLRPPGSEGFRLITAPSESAMSDNSLAGFSVWVGGRPIMSETRGAQEQVAWFAGQVRSDNSFRYLRAGYAFAAAQLFPWFGAERSLLAVNLASWLASALLAASLAHRIFGDPLAAVGAGLGVCSGIGFAIHVDSTTPHALSFACFYGGVAFLERREIGCRRWAVREHALWAMAMGIIGCCYNVATMLLAVYALCGWRRQRWRDLMGAGLIASSFKPIWMCILAALGIVVVNTEGHYAAQAFEQWRGWWNDGILILAGRGLWLLGEVASSIESPWVVLLAAWGMVALPMRTQHRVLMSASLLAALLADLAFAPVATARGYIAYGASWCMYGILGGWLVRAWRPTGSWLIRLGWLAVLALQLAWSTAHWRGDLGPAKLYFLGWDDAWPVLSNPVMQVRDLTSNLAGSHASSLHRPHSTREDEVAVQDEADLRSHPRRKWLLAVLSRAPFVMTLVLIACLGARTDGGRLLVWLIGWGLGLLLVALGMGRPLDVPRVPEKAILELPAGKSLVYRVQPTPQARQSLRAARSQTGASCYCFAPLPDGVSMAWGTPPIPMVRSPDRASHWTWSRSDSPAELEPSPWEITLTNRTAGTIQLPTWPLGNAKRQFAHGTSIDSTTSATLQVWVPTIELRVHRSDGSTAWIGF